MPAMRPIVSLVLGVALLVSCHSAPTETIAVTGTFPLAQWNDLALPVSLGFTPPRNCGRQVTSGTLTLDAQRHTFSYGIRIVNCNGFDEGSSQVEGSYAQTGSALDFTISGDAHFYGTILADRIIVTDGERLAFTRRGSR
jgi:hypothetical protein